MGVWAVLASIIILYWIWENWSRLLQFLSNVQVLLAKLVGYKVVEHRLEWKGWIIKERQFFWLGAQKEVIDYYNNAFAKRRIQFHNLYGHGSVKWYWIYL